MRRGAEVFAEVLSSISKKLRIGERPEIDTSLRHELQRQLFKSIEMVVADIWRKLFSHEVAYFDEILDVVTRGPFGASDGLRHRRHLLRAQIKLVFRSSAENERRNAGEERSAIVLHRRRRRRRERRGRGGGRQGGDGGRKRRSRRGEKGGSERGGRISVVQGMERSKAQAVSTEGNLTHDQMIHSSGDLLFGLQHKCLSECSFVTLRNQRGNSAGTPLPATMGLISLPHPTSKTVYVTNVRFFKLNSWLPN